jgi:hypothetical protein
LLSQEYELKKIGVDAWEKISGNDNLIKALKK